MASTPPPAERAASTAPRPLTLPPTLWTRLRSYAFAAVPLVAVAELAGHAAIVRAVPRDDDWRAARAFIAREKRARPTDLVASAPVWTDPLAREHLRGLISLEDAARPDATRYVRALVATIRGGEHPDFRGWIEERAVRFGRVTARVLRNPRPARVRYDFIEHLHPPDAQAYRVEASAGHVPCPWVDGQTVTGGGLGQGALAGPARFACSEPWNYVGRTVVEDMDHRGRLCIWSHPVVDVPMRTVFRDVPLGSVVRGYHVVAYEAERGGDHYETGAPITLTVRVGEQVVGRDTHVDGQGWKPFTFDTRAFAGTPREVSFEVTVATGGNRHYCFEADTR